MASKLLGRQDVLIVQNPPVFLAFSAARLARKTGARIVMWCGDVWPDVLLQSGQLKPGLLANAIRRVQQYGFSRSSLLAVTNPTIAADTRRAYRCPGVVVWSNGVDTRMFSSTRRCESLRGDIGVAPDEFMVGYIGLHGRFQGLDAVVDAAALLKAHPFRFVFVGEGVEKTRLVQRAQDAGLTKVSFLAPRPKSEMPAFVASCDVAVVSLLKRMPGTMPSKFYEALASGAIPLTADGCEAAPLVRRHEAGVLYEPGDGQSAADALLKVSRMSQDERDAMRHRCRQLALRFDRDRLANHVNATLEALVSNAPLPATDW
jgi:glycosyltransferase involved in cell wall biosynthesis